MTAAPSRTLRPVVLLFLALACAGPARAVSEGETAPSLALVNATGELVSLERLRGKVVYVDFWASWCAPCRQSFPFMNELRQRYADEGLTIVAVNVDKKRSDADRFLQQTHAAFTVVFDAAGATPSTWGVRAMPSSYLVDRQGRIAAVETGFTDERKPVIEERIRKLLQAP